MNYDEVKQKSIEENPDLAETFNKRLVLDIDVHSGIVLLADTLKGRMGEHSGKELMNEINKVPVEVLEEPETKNMLLGLLGSGTYTLLIALRRLAIKVPKGQEAEFAARNKSFPTNVYGKVGTDGELGEKRETGDR